MKVLQTKLCIVSIIILSPFCISCNKQITANRVESVTEKILRLTDGGSDTLERSLVAGENQVKEVKIANFTYKDDLTFDIFYPPGFPVENPRDSEPVPFVFFPTNSSIKLMKEWEIRSWKDLDDQISWGQVLAARGIAAVFYDTSSISEDIEDLLDLLLKQGRGLGLDMNRGAIIAYSGHGKIGIKLALDGRSEYVSTFRAAVFIHASIRAVAMSRKDIPFFVVYTDGASTEFEGMSEAFIKRGERAGLNITVRNDAAYKGFQYQEPTEKSREILAQLFEFIDENLGL